MNTHTITIGKPKEEVLSALSAELENLSDNIELRGAPGNRGTMVRVSVQGKLNIELPKILKQLKTRLEAGEASKAAEHSGEQEEYRKWRH